MSTPRDDGRIAFICAMPMELKPLTKKLGLTSKHLSGLDVEVGTVGSREVVATVTGMGTALAREVTERLLDAVEVERVVVVGITGAVDNEIAIGTLILPEAVIDGATGTEHQPAPLGDGTAMGKMWTSDDLVTDPDALAGLRARGVVSLDMETASIAAVCEQRGIPWSVFRAISDRATDGSIDAEVFSLSNQDGTPNAAAVAKYFLKHPGRIPQMAQLAKGAKLATGVAADAAIRACS